MSLSNVYQQAIDLGPDLELRVFQAGDFVERRRVREQLTLGRSAASDLVIDAAGVNLIHARVVPAVGGQWELKCVGGARLILSDGFAVDRVMLGAGVRFTIGEKLVECSTVDEFTPASGAKTLAIANQWSGDGKTDGAVKDLSAAATADAGQAIEMPRLVICPACFKDMTAVTVAARFCPKCGVQLPARNAAGFLIPPEESSPLYPVYRALRDELQAKLSDESPQVTSSMIILAYANAMLNLGWKYEHGRGLLRNVEEAARCYAKASKLSSAWGK